MPKRATHPDGTVAQRETFIQEYMLLREVNGSEAARRAGVSPGSAGKQAHRWLNMPSVQKRIEHYRAELRKRVYTDQATNMLELLYVVHSDVRHVLNHIEVRPDGMPSLKADTPEHISRSIKAITVKSKPSGEFHQCEPCRLNGKLKTCPDCRPIPEVECKIEMYDKNAALRLVMGHLGILVPKDGPDNKAMQSLADFLMALPKPKE